MVAALVAAMALALALPVALNRLPDPLAGDRPHFQPSIKVEDRQGRLLREFPSNTETRSEWVALEDMSPHLVNAAVAAEDRRFFSHYGIDPLAVLRAAWQNINSGRVISGASTITMQLARSVHPGGPRTWRRKFTEAVYALRIERSHTKNEIIEEYLNRAPCGNQVYGVPAATQLYLDKSPANLSPAEAAFILALPQAPSLLNPYRRLTLALDRRDWILDRMAELGYLNDDERMRAKAESLDLQPFHHMFQAPHFVTRVRSLLPSPPPARIRTTLDLELQTQIEALVGQTLKKVKKKGVSQAAVLVMHHRTREVLAWVGSADFWDPLEGQNDGVLALRQPGSTVKSFTYAAAFDAGLTPADLVDDRQVEYGLSQGVYKPTNYDNRFHGRVSLRTALASSLNVPAVKVLDKVGLHQVYKKMKAAGLDSLEQEPDYYGLGLTLGSGEVSLLELASAYAALADGGRYRPPVFFLDQPQEDQTRQAFSPQAAYLITHILSDDAARSTGFSRNSPLVLPFPAAAKTGTSKNFRDNWTVGYTSEVVVAVWAGNFDARPMGHVSGVTGAGPLWHRVMRLAAEYYPPQEFTRPSGLTELDVCPDTGLRAAPQCPNRKTELFMEQHQPAGYCLAHQPLKVETTRPGRPQPGLAIISPKSGERYLYDPGIEPGFQNLTLEAQGAADLDCLVWYVNNQEIGRINTNQIPLPDIHWPLKRGQATFKLIGQSKGQTVTTDQVTITIH